MPKKQHKPEATQKQPACGQTWRHKRTGLIGEVLAVWEPWPDPQEITLDITDELGCMTWRSTVPMFLARWTFVSEAP